MKKQRSFGCFPLIVLAIVTFLALDRIVSEIPSLDYWFENVGTIGKTISEPERSQSTPELTLPTQNRQTPSRCQAEISAYNDLFKRWLNEHPELDPNQDCSEIWRYFTKGEIE